MHARARRVSAAVLIVAAAGLGACQSDPESRTHAINATSHTESEMLNLPGAYYSEEEGRVVFRAQNPTANVHTSDSATDWACSNA